MENYIGKKVQGRCEGKQITGVIVSFCQGTFYDKNDKGLVKIHMDIGGFVYNRLDKIVFI